MVESSIRVSSSQRRQEDSLHPPSLLFQRVISVEVCNEQSALPVDTALTRRAVSVVLAGESVTSATISVAVVDDPTMRELNRRYLNHDYNTDVLSFLLEESDGQLDGEIIVSADTAVLRAGEFDWSAGNELLLYVIHGTLHLTGYDDHCDAERGHMRRKEMQYLKELGLDPESADPDGESRLAVDDREIPNNQKEG